MLDPETRDLAGMTMPRLRAVVTRLRSWREGSMSQVLWSERAQVNEKDGKSLENIDQY